MAIEKVYISGGGVGLAVFNAHTHNYRKVTQLGVDGTGNYATPQRVAIIDDSEVNVTDSNKVASAGLTVATQATETPN